jgi:hypothetical protein
MAIVRAAACVVDVTGAWGKPGMENESVPEMECCGNGRANCSAEGCLKKRFRILPETLPEINAAFRCILAHFEGI